MTRDLEGDRSGAAERPAYPAHVLERLGGYLGPGLRKRMAILREANADQTIAATTHPRPTHPQPPHRPKTPDRVLRGGAGGTGEQ
jgi:hypothetical protein